MKTEKTYIQVEVTSHEKPIPTEEPTQVRHVKSDENAKESLTNLSKGML